MLCDVGCSLPSLQSHLPRGILTYPLKPPLACLEEASPLLPLSTHAGLAPKNSLTTSPLMSRFLRWVALAAVATAAAAQSSNTTSAPSPCSQFAIQTMTAQPVAGSLVTASIKAACPVPIFQAVTPSTTSGSFSVNLRGDFVYVPPASSSQVLDIAYADVSCLSTYLCRLPVAITVSQPLTLPTPTAPGGGPVTTAAPTVPACPNVYYYVAPLGQVLSATLRNQIGQLPCDLGRNFKINRPSALGSVMLVANGDFSYTSPSQESWDDFGFDMYCFQTQICSGSAFVLVSASVTNPPTAAATPSPASPGSNGGGGGTVAPTPSPGPTAPPVIQSPLMTCQGTCNQLAWKAVASLPNMWDTTKDDLGGYSQITPRKDGKAIGSVEVAWDMGDLIIMAYSTIGNVAARFPSFEPFSWAKGDGFTSAEVNSKVSPLSVPFDTTCLDNQPAWGMGEEVWRWTSLANKTGSVGKRYNSGATWYHKFGGKHLGCDTMAQSCKYAPLLTPRNILTTNPDVGGWWMVDVNDCDVTWTGRFNFAAVRNMVTKNGSPVFRVRDGHVMEATIYMQGVKPLSWLEPSKGYVTDVIARKMLIDLSPFVSVQQSQDTANLFSTDLRFFSYQTDNKDIAFGLNLLIYPVAMQDSFYAPDRHVTGFRWIRQAWSRPNSVECPTCTGMSRFCNVDPNLYGDGTFLASSFPQGNCSSPRISLIAGPKLPPGICVPNRMHVMNRAGFSMPQGCSATFQNLTIRGIATGSGKMPNMTADSMSFEGELALQLLLDNGQKPVLKITLSRYVATSTVDSGLRGRVSACRASPYWPVLDPLGASLPDQPYALAASSTYGLPGADTVNGLPSGVLCFDPLDRMFGPQGWALIVFDVVGFSAPNVVVESIYLTYFENPGRVYLVANDPITGASLGPPAFGASTSGLFTPPPTQPPSAGQNPFADGVSSWWVDTHPFLNFRDITNTRLANRSITYGFGVAPIDQGGDVAIMLTPGAVALNTDVSITCVAKAYGPSPDGGKTQGPLIGKIKMTSLLHADPTLRTMRTVVTADKSYIVIGGNSASLLAIAIVGGVIAVVLVGTGIFAVTEGADGKGLPMQIRKTFHSTFAKQKKAKEATQTGPKERTGAFFDESEAATL